MEEWRITTPIVWRLQSSVKVFLGASNHAIGLSNAQFRVARMREGVVEDTDFDTYTYISRSGVFCAAH